MEECLLHIDTKTNTISVNNGIRQPEPIPDGNYFSRDWGLSFTVKGDKIYLETGHVKDNEPGKYDFMRYLPMGDVDYSLWSDRKRDVLSRWNDRKDEQFRREYNAERFRREHLVEVIKEKITEEEFDAFIEWVHDNY